MRAVLLLGTRSYDAQRWDGLGLAKEMTFQARTSLRYVLSAATLLTGPSEHRPVVNGSMR